MLWLPGGETKTLATLNKAQELDPKYDLAAVNRLVVEKSEEGKGLQQSELKSVDFYADSPTQKKSYIEETLKKMQTRLSSL